MQHPLKWLKAVEMVIQSECEMQLAIMLLSAGLRPIANLGSSSVAVFPGTSSRLSCKRPRQREKVKLVFKPVNKQLQGVLQVMSNYALLSLHRFECSCSGTAVDTGYVYPLWCSI